MMNRLKKRLVEQGTWTTASHLEPQYVMGFPLAVFRHDPNRNLGKRRMKLAGPLLSSNSTEAQFGGLQDLTKKQISTILLTFK
jgi:hypothetical protein